MGQLCIFTILCLALILLLHGTSAIRKGKSSKKPPNTKSSTSSSSNKPHQGSKYPSRGGVSPGGYPHQSPAGGSYPARGSYPSGGQYPGQGGSIPGGYPNQYPAGGSYPAGGQYPGQGGSSPGGYPNQYPAGGNYPAGRSYPGGAQYPGQGGSRPGGYPNQYPGRGGGVNQGGYPNQYPAGGSYPSGGQYPGGVGVSPNQYPAGRGYPAGGSYPNQYPGKINPAGYPVGGVYPVRTGEQPGGFPGGYPSTGGSYPNWNPNNKILNPRYGGGFGGPGYGIGGSPFSKSVQKMGYAPTLKSKGFAKKALLAAGLGTMTGMAVGYGLGRFPQPHFHFSSRQEEYYYNYYMHRHYGMKSTDTNDYRHDYTSNPPPQAQTYEKYMDKCMNRTDLLQKRDTKISSIQGDHPITGLLAVSNGNAENRIFEVPVPVESQESNDDTVNITEIGYPALIQQMKTRKCVELYMVYSESFLQKQTQQPSSNRSDPNGHPGLLVLLTTAIIALSSTLLLQ